MALSDAWLKSNNGKLRDKVEVVADRDSLSVRISPKGKIVFQYRYRFNGKAKRIDVGTYPLMSLKDARNQIINYQTELDQGKDPLQLKLKEEVTYIAQPTVKQISDEWFAVIAKDKVSVEGDKRAFEIHVYPRLGKRICDEVTLQEWSKLLFTIAGYAKTVSVKILGNLKMIMRWGSIHGKLKYTTLQHLRAVDLNVKKNVGTRYLTEQEIFWVVHSMMQSKLTPKNKALYLLLLIFGCRVSELRTARKSDFDFLRHIWTIPPEQHKTGHRSRKAIIRPLIPQVEELLKQVFALSPKDCLYAFPEMRADRYGMVKKGFQTTIPPYITEKVKEFFGVSMPDWVTHDLRRTMRTHIAEFAPPHICEIMLGHALPQIWGTYDLNEYVEPQAKAYAKWFDKLCAILSDYDRFDNGSMPRESIKPFLDSQSATALIP
ncbi:integrase family protein [Acinetobacter sp. ME22]|uniref:tyrosine-type recombinase/integrase n=1 Tax=Acinetobacter sp. ME22 TaxID=2904802 RepID=UPI001EDBDE28|nr:integrase family protein [Acinetobacter sp. ME22]MCG2572283.1 integrase family protein [Acinetobacter sp. ME22]